MKKLNHDERIQRAIIALLRHDPLYAEYLLRWPRTVLPKGTMAVNGKELKVCPAFVDSLTDGQLRVVLKHEVMHVMMKHPIREAGYHAAETLKDDRMPPAEVHAMMNVAGDLEINDLLCTDAKDAADFPASGLRTGVAPYADHPKNECLEAHFDILRGKRTPPPPPPPPPDQDDDGDEQDEDEQEQDDQEQQNDTSDGDDGQGGAEKDGGDPATGDGDGEKQGGDQPSGGDGDDEVAGFGGMGEFQPDPEAQTPADIQRLNQEYDQVLISSVMAAQQHGKVPAWAKEMVDAITAPAKVPWQVLLRRWAKKVVREGESTFSRPSRRSMYRSDIVLPSKRSSTMKRVMLIADTSGSMATAAVNTVVPEALKIMQTWKQAELILVQCDAQVADEATYKPRSGFVGLKAFAKSPVWKGRGGTDMAPAFRLVTKYKPEVIICLTDGYMSWPDKIEAKGVPVVWLMVSDIVPPWGDKIRM